MTSFADLKKNSGSEGIKVLQEQLEGMNKKREKKDYTDSRFWNLTVDSAKNGTAVIRFLPAAKGESLPFVKIQYYSFQAPSGVYYIENCLHTINQADPMAEYISSLWDSKIAANIEMIKKFKMRKKDKYIANIYVVKDPGNPENEGKTFLFEFGRQIFGIINEMMYPKNEGLEPTDDDYKQPVNPFDFWSGANFRFISTMKDGFRNYDSSQFSKQSAFLEGDDKKLQAIWDQEVPLLSFLDASNFKTYDQLKARLDRVLGNKVAPKEKEMAKSETKSTSAPVKNTVVDNDDNTTIDDDGDDDLAFLKDL